MAIFLIIGTFGVVALLASLLLDDLLDGLFESFDNDLVGGPAISAFLAAFGFGGALALYAGWTAGQAVIAGLGGGVALGAAAALLSRSLMNMATDETVTSAHYVGADGTVVSPIAGDGEFGEVSVVVAGHPVKLTARAAEPLSAGTSIRVVASLSATSVRVERTA